MYRSRERVVFIFEQKKAILVNYLYLAIDFAPIQISFIQSANSRLINIFASTAYVRIYCVTEMKFVRLCTSGGAVKISMCYDLFPLDFWSQWTGAVRQIKQLLVYSISKCNFGQIR